MLNDGSHIHIHVIMPSYSEKEHLVDQCLSITDPQNQITIFS